MEKKKAKKGKPKKEKSTGDLRSTTKALASNLAASGIEPKFLEALNDRVGGQNVADKIITTSCANDCGGKCLLRVHVRDGVISAITTDEGKGPQVRACPKGYLQHHRLYHPDRLKYPMKRVGERGEGRFERISWDEAFDIVEKELRRVKDEFGVKAIFSANWCGSLMVLLHTTIFGCVTRFFNLLSDDGLGATKYGNSISLEAGHFASKYMYGAGFWFGDGNEPDDYPNSRLMILWGFNPAESIQGANSSFWIARAREAGCRIICVDPCYSSTARLFAEQWIPIRPGTDAAMLIAMAYVMITENLQNQAFLDKYTVGFGDYTQYVLGVEDKIPKTPQWAERITGVPAETISNLAREYATTKPAALIQGMAPGKTVRGEQYHRAAATLQAMTGNIGIHGGSSATQGAGWPYKAFMTAGIPTRRDPDDFTEVKFGGYDHFKEGIPYIKAGRWPDVVLRGKSGGYPSDIKMVYIVGHNLLNQCQNTNKGVKALKQVETVICHEQFMTPTAKFADILLPATHEFERDDIAYPWLKGTNIIYAHKIMEPLGECKTDLDMFTELARRLGIEDYNPHTDDEWLRSFVDKSLIEDYDEFKEKGVWMPDLAEPHIAFKEQIEDPENNPFNTPSGKIEIYIKSLEDLDFEKSFYKEYIPPLPIYMEPPEGPDDPLTKKYPLQLITSHFKHRTHSTFANVSHLRALYTHEIWINSIDARARGITHGDDVLVFNDRGTVALKAKLTERVIPGVVKMYQGTWFNPDENGIDRGGCVNVLSSDRPSPAGATNVNTCLVQVKKE